MALHCKPCKIVRIKQSACGELSVDLLSERLATIRSVSVTRDMDGREISANAVLFGETRVIELRNPANPSNPEPYYVVKPQEFEVSARNTQELFSKFVKIPSERNGKNEHRK